MGESITYTPPPTIRKFITTYRQGGLFQHWIVGPYGSGKTTGLFMKLVFMAKLQKPGRDGVRRSRAVIVRNTSNQLKDTTLTSWNYWFKPGQAGIWRETDKKFTLRFDDVECEVLFRPLDTEDDVRRVLSLEVTFAIIDEFVELPRKIIEALMARCGRYPSAKDGGATNWGMWGASNPSTEDNWWHDYLFRRCGDPNQNMPVEPFGLYFQQPSGLGPAAENLENLPGERDYYDSLCQGKSEAWIHQYVHANWGFSVSGQPIVATFNPALHLAKGLLLNPRLPLILGLDPGLAGSAVIFGQMDLDGRLNVLGELVQSGYGADRLVKERIIPYIRARWPGYPLDQVIIAPDPAAMNRAQTDEKSVVDRLKIYFKVECESNNRFPLRLNAIEHFTCRLINGAGAVRIDENECPVLVRAVRGGWRWKIDPKKSIIVGQEAEDNQYTHSGDAWGYLCRYFHRQTEREMRYGFGPNTADKRRFRPPAAYKSTYHMR